MPTLNEEKCFENVLYWNRLCNISADTEIGDEYHYILQCKSLANETTLYLSQYCSRGINTLKLINYSKLKINQN